ncbi:MAG: hypothetical protein HOV94_06220 [Saccharothrix sp.]|nr:hypothetical protein [Saccharothrix sp.]
MTIVPSEATAHDQPAGRTGARVDLMVDVIRRHTVDPGGTCRCGDTFDIELEAVDGGASGREWQAHVMQAVLVELIDSVGAELPEPVAGAVQAARLVDDLAVHQVLASHQALLEEVRIALISYDALHDTGVAEVAHYSGQLDDARADIETLTAIVKDRNEAIVILARELRDVRRELATHDRQAARDRIVRQAQRDYGRASATIGRLRGILAQHRERIANAQAEADHLHREVTTARVRLRHLLGLEGEDFGALPLDEMLTRVGERLHRAEQGGDGRG